MGCMLDFRIPLFDGDHNVVDWALVDHDDMYAVAAHRWYLDDSGYAIRSQWLPSLKKSRTFSMHRELLGLRFNDGVVVDHINRRRLDNRRENLRMGDVQLNAHNKGARPGSTSKYRGVHWAETNKKWMVTVGINGTRNYLGCYDDEDEAGRIAADFRLLHMEGAVD